ncbi:Peptidase S41 family protein [Pleurostoma richardsiae]|uniref:Peptidase S41 family protein n=1 Tax=Pleurostoma richardsiae TaxID=41990 RepID=A0AA38RW10_9PEZI|nr:Peptidase S41 family protein [Pleurostoma richardsiae]
MPFREDLALKFIDEYMKYLQFHSSLEGLKHPPSTYISPSVDITRGLAKLRRRTVLGSYSTQFDFDYDFSDVISRANDGHLKTGLCSQEIFHFEHGVPLVSVSVDGLQIPQLYTYSDAELLSRGVTAVAPITEINDVDAVYYLQAHLAINLGYQDPDARYNRLFPSPTANFSGSYSGGAWTTHVGLWPGTASYTVRFSNRSELQVETTASWPASNGPMVYMDGEELFKVACTQETRKVLGSYPGSFMTVPTFSIPPSGASVYPEPVARSQDRRLQGYYLDAYSVNDVAVLQVPTFYLGDGPADFAKTAAKFVKQAASDGKGRLILDLSGNDGGDVVPGFNLFRIFFPGQPIHSATRFRATELVALMGEVFSEIYSNDVILDPPLVYGQAIGSDQRHRFGSWEDLYGPHDIRGTNMSSLYAHFDFDMASSKTDPINGFGGIPPDPSQQLFRAEDIVVLTDGHCASTCAILVHLLRSQGVRSIAFGGRPRLGPMQAVGGVKGAQKWSLRTIDNHVAEALKHASPVQAARITELAPPGVGRMSLRFDTYGQGSVNFRNAYGGDDVKIPLQFVYEAADCRRFFTSENVVRPETVWVDAAIAMFRQDVDFAGSMIY